MSSGSYQIMIACVFHSYNGIYYDKISLVMIDCYLDHLFQPTFEIEVVHTTRASMEYSTHKQARNAKNLSQQEMDNGVSCLDTPHCHHQDGRRGSFRSGK